MSARVDGCLLNFAGPMLQVGKPFSNSNSLDEHLLFGENRDESIQVTASLGEALLPFIDCKLDKPTSFHSHSPSLDNLTDASDSGWSGVIGRHRVQDCWTPSEFLSHINVKEIIGILYSIQVFQDVLSSRTILHFFRK